ncbi:hypothetical protein HYW76_01355 [Candidatus Pacearchaeota archaeon]|nr:hypothetical protein [Candidatus Pacearchaeota archaeon]
MEEDAISIQRIIGGRAFYRASVADALQACQTGDFGKGPTKPYDAQFMPVIIDTRINSSKSARIWETWFSSLSVRVTGRTSLGSSVVVYGHTPNYFSNPKNIRISLDNLRNGAGIMPQKEFQKLVDLDEAEDDFGNRLVWVVDYETLKKSKSGLISVSEALEHPQTIPFLGGENRAIKYLQEHKINYGNDIGVWHFDDLDEHPRGRLLVVGNNCNNNLNGNNNLNNNGRFVGIALAVLRLIFMKTYKNLYEEIYSLNNLTIAWRKARKGKTKKDYVREFENDVLGNLFKLQEELKNKNYSPMPLKTFILRDPKTRKISKSAFRDRVVHHALVRIIKPIFDKAFIYDSCANRIGKGNLFALKRFNIFKRKVSNNGDFLDNKFNDKNFVFGYCFKADIKHYFEEVSHDILINRYTPQLAVGIN